MDRFPHQTPCRVSIEELAYDRGLQEFSAEDLKDAREEIVEQFTDGPRLWEALQGWLNVDARLYDERLSIIAKQMQTLLSGEEVAHDLYPTYKERREASYACARATARIWLEEIVREYITDEMVEEHAEKIAAQKLEDA